MTDPQHIEGDDLPNGHAPIEVLPPFLARRIGTIATEGRDHD